MLDDGHGHGRFLQHGLRDRAEQRAAQRTSAARADDDGVAAKPLRDVEQRVAGFTVRDLALVTRAGLLQQCFGTGQRMHGGIEAGGFQQGDIGRQDHLVQIGGLLHVGQHEAGPQAFAQQPQGVVNCVERKLRAVDGKQDQHERTPVSGATSGRREPVLHPLYPAARSIEAVGPAAIDIAPR